MTEGIRRERLQTLWKNSVDKGHTNYAEVLGWLLGDECTELDPWLPIETSIVDNNEYLFITKTKKQRVDRFHPSQYAKVNTDLRWQERPGDRYTHYKLLK